MSQERFLEIHHGPKPVAVVFLHGLGLNKTYFRPLLERVRDAGWSYAAADLPGHGHARSVVANDYAAVCTYLESSLLRERLGSCVIFGHSYGGLVALALEERKQLPIRALVLGASSYAVDWRTVRPTFVLFGLPLCKAINHAVWRKQSMGEPEVDLSRKSPTWMDLGLVCDSSRATGRRSMRSSVDIMRSRSFRSRLANVGVPLLVIEPTRDQIFTRHSYAVLERCVPAARRVRVEATHDLARNWSVVSRQLEDFLSWVTMR